MGVYAVSVGRLGDRKFLRDLCKITGGTLFEIESTCYIGAVFVGILDEFRQRYLLTYTPEGVGENGWHALKVCIGNRRYDRVSVRQGYMRNPPAPD